MRLLLTGASGQLGAYLLRELARHRHGIDVTAWSGSQVGSLFGFPLLAVDLADAAAVAAAFRQARPDAVLHAGALASVAACYRDPEGAREVNAGGTRRLAELAGGSNARLLFVSTDLVFDGEHAPYREEDPLLPLSVYGRTKADGETSVLANPGNVVVRLSLLFGPSLTERKSFFDQQLAALQAQTPWALFEDEWRTPLALPTAAAGLVALVESSVTGVLHLGGPERLSRLEMGHRLARYLALDPAALIAARRAESAAPEPRPGDVSLDSSRWRRLFPDLPWPGFEEALAAMLTRR